MSRAIDVVRQVAPKAKATYLAAFENGDALLRQHGINTPDRLAHFLAQVLHESGGLTLDRESMKYGAARLLEIFGEGRHSAAITPGEAERIALDERTIAERVYGLGNPRKAKELGNTETGDGFRYRGCGLMQTTGRGSYRRMSELCGVDFEKNPEWICSAEHALKPALAEWSEAGLSIFADHNDILSISRAINCGTPKSKKIPNGMQDRATWFAKTRPLVQGVEFKATAAAADKPSPPARLNALSRAELASESLSKSLGERILTVGDEGPVVRSVQLAFAKLGYCLRGSGYFAGATLAAVKDFQLAQGLRVNGKVGIDTAVAIDRALANLRPKKTGPISPIAGLIGGRILHIGDEGPIIRATQLALARLGYPLQGTGNFGPLTEQAVKDFQTHHGLGVDGEVGPETAMAVDRALVASLETAQSPTAARKRAKRPTKTRKRTLDSITKLLGNNILTLGDQGSTVRAAQIALARLGHAVSCTGLYDGATEASVTDFQQQHALEADGEIGPVTAVAIDQALAGGRKRVRRGTKSRQSVVQSEIRPTWLIEGLKWIDTREVGGSADNPVILKWAADEGGAISTVYKHDSIPWCALYANMILTKVGIKGTETLWALDWNNWGQKLAGPAVGAFAPMKRDGGGHIAIVVGRDKDGRLLCLGGNQNDNVTIAAVPPERPLSFRWPVNVASPLNIGFDSLPVIGLTGLASTKES